MTQRSLRSAVHIALKKVQYFLFLYLFIHSFFSIQMFVTLIKFLLMLMTILLILRTGVSERNVLRLAK